MKLTSTQIDSDGIPFVEWEEESLLLANSRYRFSLISRFGDRRPTLLEIREWCSKAWSLTGKISLSALKKGLIWIHFECEENKVLEKGQYWVWKTAMFLHRWCPGLDLDELLLSAWVVGYEMSGVEEIYFSSKKHTKNVIMESAEDGLWETPRKKERVISRSRFDLLCLSLGLSRLGFKLELKKWIIGSGIDLIGKFLASCAVRELCLLFPQKALNRLSSSESIG